MHRRLEGKSAVITGGSRGIGKAVAAAFLREGARVMIAARDSSALEETAREFQSQGKGIPTFVLDVSDLGAVRQMVARAEREFGRVDVLVNGAGIYGPIGPLVDADPELWRKTVEINLLGTMYSMQAVLPGMMRRRSGRIINFSGGGAVSPLPRFSAYGASKAAVVRLTETIAGETQEFNIRINAIAPGGVNTRLLGEVLEAGERAGAAFLARARKQKEAGGVPPERAADLAVFLASDESAGLTGRLISAVYDDWSHLPERAEVIQTSDLYTLRRIDEKLADILYPEWRKGKAGKK